MMEDAGPTPERNIGSPIPALKKKKPRLVFKKLVLNNFKSYAGKHTIGIFDNRMNCIVGPNGSGKSNIVDAVQFLFGKKGKKLRLKTLRELIHKSSSRPNCRYAHVEGYFEEIVEDPITRTLTPVLGSQFKIKRRVNIKSNSKYYLNDKPVKRDVIRIHMEKKGMNIKHNRFLILQGEVEHIALFKPKSAKKGGDDGLLEYVEDKIGTRKYEVLIDKKYETVEELDEKRGTKLNHAKTSEKAKNVIEGQKNEAELYLRKNIDLHLKKNRVHAYEQNCFTQEILDIEEKHQKEYDQLRDLEEKLRQEKSVKEGLTLALKTSENKYKEAVKKKQSCKEKVKQLQLREENVKKDLDKKTKKREKCQTDISEHTDNVAKMEKKIVSFKKKEEKLKEKLPTLEEDLKNAKYSLEEIYKENEEKLQPLEEEIEKKRKQLAPLVVKQSDIEAKILEWEEEKKLIIMRLEREQKEYTGVKKRVEEVGEKLSQKDSEYKESRRILKKLEETVGPMENKINQLKSNSNLDSERNKLKNLQDRKRSLEREKGSEISRNKVAQVLLECKARGTISGIHDRLGSLGKIDGKYDCAISTACRQLDSIVCETSECGKQCIAHLRSTRAGRGHFLLMDTIHPICFEKAADTRPFRTPENVPRLFDLVTTKNKFRPVFYSALNDTLVAKDIIQARRIAFKSQVRWRVVTLDGKMIETTGVMSGGGIGKRGRMTTGGGRTVVSQEDILRASKEIEKQEELVNKMDSQISDLERNVSKFRSEIQTTHVKIRKLEVEVKSLTNQMKNAKKEVEEIESRMGDEEAEQEKADGLEKKVKKTKGKELKKAQKEVEKMGEEIKELKDEMKEVGGVQLEQQKAKVQELEKEVKRTSREITQVNEKQKTTRKRIEKMQVQQKKRISELEELKQTVEGIENQLKNIEEKMNTRFQEYKQAKVEIERLKKEITDEREKIHKCEKKMEEWNMAVLQLKAVLEEDEKRKKEIEVRIKMIKRKVESNEKQIEEDRKLLSINGETENEESQGAEAMMEMSQKMNFEEASRMAVTEETKSAVLNEIKTLEQEIEGMNINLNILEEYRDKFNTWRQRLRELEDTTEERDKARIEYEKLKKKRLTLFMEGFCKISLKLKEIYRMITMGGDAELELVDSLDPFSEGIVLSVRPPKKSWKNISNLSGGEKTLSSLALVYALHHYKPTPIYIMDEIDAALDYKNVTIVGNYIKERAANAQFIIVSLRNNLFDLANTLVGVYKTDERTKTVSLIPQSVSVPVINNNQNEEKKNE